MFRTLVLAALRGAVVGLLLVNGSLPAWSQALSVTVEAGTVDRKNSPVHVPIKMPGDTKNLSSVSLTDAAGKTLPAQITHAALVDPPGYELNFVLPELKAGHTAKFTATLGGPAASPSFVWKDTPNEHDDLLFGDRSVLRYMDAPLDESTKDRRVETFKVYHHVYDPEKGEVQLTKGVGSQFTHHRGLFFGFNRITYGPEMKSKADVWHCTGDAHQSHEGILQAEAGPVLGRQLLAIDWHGEKKEVFAKEERELTAYSLPGGTLVEFAARLKTTGGNVRLDGDPQHSGFQFRANAEVSDKTAKQTYYLRPDGQGKDGETRNWDAKKRDPLTINQPWKAMCFVIGGKRYTAAYLDRPENPKEARYSERDYGRTGSYFEYDLTADHPLLVNYRVWFQAGEMTIPQVSALDDDFANPVKATAE